MRGPMERIFEADTREQVNQKADEWWAKAKGLRFVHRIRSYPSKRWAIVCASVLGMILSCRDQVQAGIRFYPFASAMTKHSSSC
jgi:hypothetical protein